MTRIKSSVQSSKVLRNVLLKDQDAISLLQEISKKLGINFSVTDNIGKTYWNGNGEMPFQFELNAKEQLVGKVQADSEEGRHIQSIIQMLVAKELEKKKIGAEVLGLYR